MKTRRKTGTGRTKQAAPRKRPAATRQSQAAARKPVTAARNTAAIERTKAEIPALAADCTIAETRAMKAQLARAVARQAPVTLDFSKVRRVDTACLQLLAAFIRERRAAGREVECRGASESFLITAQLLGLGALFSAAIDQRLSAPAAGNA